MSGIFLISIVAIWFFVTLKLSGFIVSKCGATKKSLTRFSLFVMIFLLPLLDEIVGGVQFRSLCNSNEILVNQEMLKGKTVQLKRPANRILKRVIPIRESVWEWVDPHTGDVLIKYKDYHAKGGWLSRFIGFPQGSPPYTFNGSCESKKARLIFDELKIAKDVKSYYGE